MKLFILLTAGLIGTAVSIYLGFYLCFIGGILDVSEAIKAPSLPYFELACGVGKMMIAAPVSYVVATLVWAPITIILNEEW